jgi:hypothetical protein
MVSWTKGERNIPSFDRVAKTVGSIVRARLKNKATTFGTRLAQFGLC